MNSPNWKTLNSVSDDRLFEARAQLHQAAQLLAGVGISYLEKRADDSHTAMLWSSMTLQFLSQTFGADNQFQVALNPLDLGLSIMKDGTIIEQLDLNGENLKQTATVLKSFLEGQGLPPDVFTMEKHYELPEYPDRWETAFDNSDTEAFGVIAYSFANASALFEDIQKTDSRAGDLLIWPHHFDLATLITTATDTDGNLTKSIGVGISPGDGSYTAPYYYVNPWPAPTSEQIPGDMKSQGHWHTEYWTGMVLTLDPFRSVSDPQEQQAIAKAYLEEALVIANSLSY